MAGSGLHCLPVLALASLLTACAATPGDPFEPVNRAVYGFNRHFNDTVTLPVAWVYTYKLGKGVKQPLHDFLSNLQSPVTFTNDLLQGHVQGAAETLARFLLNSTAGFAGFSDFAARHANLPAHQADFGQTLAQYGIGSGPFIVLPIIGPTTVRDAFGGVADLAASPLAWVPADWPFWGHALAVSGVESGAPYAENARALYLRTQMTRTSVDPYVTMRSAAMQYRDQQLGDGVSDLPPD